MSRTYRRDQKDARRRIRRETLARKHAGLMSQLAVLGVLAAGLSVPSWARAQDANVTVIERTDLVAAPAGMESPFYSLHVWDAGRAFETVAAEFVGKAECEGAAAVLWEIGADAGCVPMGRIAGLQD